MRFRKVWIRNGLVYRRRWRGSFIGSFIYPLLLLSAMGLGLGRLISQNRPGSFGAGGYLGFVASGLIAAVCMQSTVFEASFPMLDRIKDRRTFDAILATPLGIRDILFGEMAWLATRASTV
ncbi:MAG TPA: ABC transporter, partial [Actinomycetota bacterium]|nr:ABC transporter [Actinomycetota bacterium]